MAKRTFPLWGRRSGWPPEQSGHTGRVSLSSDEVVLVVLWIVVLAGFVLVTFVALVTFFGWDPGLASTASAAPDGSTGDSPAALVGEMPATPSMQELPQTSLHAVNSGVASSLPDEAAGASSNANPAETALNSSSGAVLTRVAGRPIADVSSSVGVTLGRVIESSMHSDILDMDLPYRVYLPPGYDAGNQRYPTLYMLHGNGAAVYAEWTDDNKIGIIADALIGSGKIKPMIIVMPDGEHSYWMNHYGDGERWQDYVLDEVIPFFDANLRTVPTKAGRAIGGHSMGGAGALAIAMTHPELFAAVGGHSPSLRWTSMGGMPYFGPDWYFDAYNPLEIARTAKGLSTLKIWVDYGAEDYWLEDGSLLDFTLSRRGIDFQWHINPGNHYVTYWIEHSPEYLQFYSEAFSSSGEF